MKSNRRRNGKIGWARTKSFPHERHPATYRRKKSKSDDVEYITFTHSEEVDMGRKGKIRTVPLLDNISPKERENNRAKGLKQGENRSYAFPKVYSGKRSALGSESNDFNPVDFDKKRIEKMFEVFPHENVPTIKGRTKKRRRKKKN